MRTILMALAWVAVFCNANGANDPCPAPVQIIVERKMHGDACTMGYLIVQGEVVAYTLELPWLYNINDISSIPEGRYGGFIRVDGTRGWRIELLDVQGRKNVQVHIGNYTSQTKGCILVGTGANVDGCTVADSGKALSTVRERMETAVFLGMVNSSPEIAFTVR